MTRDASVEFVLVDIQQCFKFNWNDMFVLLLQKFC